jgi:hypothetical protein
MASITPIRSKLAKVVAMLSSDNIGVRRNAWRALENLLDGAGCSFVDVAKLIEPDDANKNSEQIDGKYSETELQEIYQAAYLEGQQSVQPAQPHQIDWPKIADAFVKYIDDLNDREREFVVSVIARIRVNYPLSEKQEKWAKDIFVKLGRRYGFTL